MRAAGLASLGTSVLVLVALAAPATAATAPAAVEGSDPGTASVSDMAAEAAPASLPPNVTSDGAGIAPQVPEDALSTAEQPAGIAQTATVSPAIAHDQLIEGPETAAEPTAVSGATPSGHGLPSSADLEESGSVSGVAGEAGSPAASNVPAQSAATPKTTQSTVESQKPAAQDRSQYRTRKKQYRPQIVAEDPIDETAAVPNANVRENVRQVREAIPEDICLQTSCSVGDQPEALPAPNDAIDPTTDLNTDQLISDLLEEIDAKASCGNANISVRISSPGNGTGISQTAPSGNCGRNTNISIRINSPGDDGPVSQSVSTTDTIHLRSPLLHSPRVLRLQLERARGPYLGLDPATFSRRLERSATQFAWSLVRKAQAQAKVNKAAPRQAKPRSTWSRQQSRSSARARAYSAGGSGVASARVDVSSRVSVRTSQRTRTAPRKTKRTSVTVSQSPMERLAAPALPRLPEPQAASTGGPSFGPGAFFAALLIALVGAYLIVPPMRPARANRPSMFRWPNRGGAPR